MGAQVSSLLTHFHSWSFVTTMSTIPADLHGFLNPTDHVAISFWIVSIAMVASTRFFLMESMGVGDHWKTSLNVGALVTLIAAVHYFYMREYWVQLQASPIVYRYIDWTLTVPLQMIEFFLILQAVKPDLGAGMFFRLLIGTVLMLLFGYMGGLDHRPMGRFHRGHVRLVLHPLRDLHGRGRQVCESRHAPGRGQRVWHHAFHRNCRLVHLPAGLLLRLLARRRLGQPSELDLQPCGLRQQDLVLPGHLGRSKEGHPGQEAGGRPQGAIGQGLSDDDGVVSKGYFDFVMVCERFRAI